MALCKLAEHYGIDAEGKGISMRGHIYYSEFEEEEKEDFYLLTFETETAWTVCNDLFEAINEALNNELSISYREVECGCEIYCVHDEADYFPEACCVSSSDEPFEDACEETFNNIEDAINLWCSLTGISKDGRDQEQMMEFINEYEYDDKDTYFNIHPFAFE